MKRGVDFRAVWLVGELQVFRYAIRARKRPKIMIERDVFLDDVDEVFDGNVPGVLGHHDDGRGIERGE
jgi:hypothetical protein